MLDYYKQRWYDCHNLHAVYGSSSLNEYVVAPLEWMWKYLSVPHEGITIPLFPLFSVLQQLCMPGSDCKSSSSQLPACNREQAVSDWAVSCSLPVTGYIVHDCGNNKGSLGGGYHTWHQKFFLQDWIPVWARRVWNSGAQKQRWLGRKFMLCHSNISSATKLSMITCLL